MSPTLDLDALHLDKGDHGPGTQMCVMEAVAYIAGEPWTDSPECASPVIGAFLRSWNDSLPDDDRQNLKRYIPALVGSKGTPEVEDARSWMALDWLVRTYTPTWLRLAKLDSLADLLAGLPEFRAGMDVPSIRPTIEAVRKDSAAAGAAAWDAVRDAAWDAAGDAARAAAGAAARDAAWAAAGDAARAAAGAAAGAAARAAARAAAWDAARAAAGAAAGAAAWDALRPTVETLQTSAHELVERMLAVAS